MKANSEDSGRGNDTARTLLDHRCGAGRRAEGAPGRGVPEEEGRGGYSTSFSFSGPAGGA